MMTGTINDPLEFVHPIDISQSWKVDFCSECHKDLY
jgi:hypothetical protein